MNYDDYVLEVVAERFDLQVREGRVLDSIPEVPLDPRVRHLLDRGGCIARGSNTAKARCEFLVAPILGNITVRWGASIRLFSGLDMPAAPDLGLQGEADFVFSRSRSSSLFHPFLVVVTINNENLAAGLGPCVARLLGARLLDDRDRSEAFILFGLITNGDLWRFVKLRDDQVTIDCIEYGLDRVDEIHSVLAAMLGDQTQSATTGPAAPKGQR